MLGLAFHGQAWRNRKSEFTAALTLLPDAGQGSRADHRTSVHCCRRQLAGGSVRIIGEVLRFISLRFRRFEEGREEI